jgi:hypothetical protein
MRQFHVILCSAGGLAAGSFLTLRTCTGAEDYRTGPTPPRSSSPGVSPARKLANAFPVERRLDEYHCYPVLRPARVGRDAEPRSRRDEAEPSAAGTYRWLKTATANRTNRLLGTTGGAFGQSEYYDRWIRSDEQLASAIAYVEENPVRSGLAVYPEQWRWSITRKAPAARPPALPVGP